VVPTKKFTNSDDIWSGEIEEKTHFS